MNAPFNPDLLARLRGQLSREPKQLLIDGRWSAAASGETFETRDPATGEVLAHVAAGDAADVDRAVAAARKAFEGVWRETKPDKRTLLLLKLADLIEADGDGRAEESLDNGMPFMMAQFGRVGGAASSCATMPAGRPSSPARRSDSGPGEWHATSLREPVGVVGAIVPWNFPLVMAVGEDRAGAGGGLHGGAQAGRADAADALELGELIAEAGFPAAWSTSSPASARPRARRWSTHPGVDKIAFTGSTRGPGDRPAMRRAISSG